MEVQLKPADIFLTRGTGLLSKAIRFFSTTIGESRAKVNHVGIVVKEGSLHDAIVIEALSRVKKHTLWKRYGPFKGDLVAVYHPLNLTEEEVEKIVSEAEEQVGEEYGYFKIVAHFLDWLCLGIYFFRRFADNGKYPICSWLVAHAYSKADKNFGCDPGAAEPDDIWHFVNENKAKYKDVYPLQSIWKKERSKLKLKKVGI